MYLNLTDWWMLGVNKINSLSKTSWQLQPSVAIHLDIGCSIFDSVCVSRVSVVKGHFPKLADCAHFHYDNVDLGSIVVGVFL